MFTLQVPFIAYNLPLPIIFPFLVLFPQWTISHVDYFTLHKHRSIPNRRISPFTNVISLNVVPFSINITAIIGF